MGHDQPVVAQLAFPALEIEQRDSAPRRVTADDDSQPQVGVLEHVA